MANVDVILSKADSFARGYATEARRVLEQAVTASSGRMTLNTPQIGEPGEIPDYELGFAIPKFNSSYNVPAFDGDDPDYEDVHAIGDVAYPAPVVLDFDGLFEQPKPDTGLIGSFNKPPPELDVQGLADEMDTIKRPVLSDIDQPLLSEVTVGDAPSVDLPEFNQTVVLKPVADPDNLKHEFETAYDRVLPVMRGFISDTVSEWYQRYAPGLQTSLAQLSAKIDADMVSGRALSNEFETALFNRARSRAEQEGDRVQAELERGVSRRGFGLPPGALNAGRVQVQQSTSASIAQQAMELAIERAKMEMQHVQFVMSLSHSLNQGLINSALQYATTLSAVNNQALQYATQVATQVAATYDRVLANARLNIDILNAQARVYETELKAALAVYESFRLELETAKLTLAIDDQKITVYTAQLDAQTTKIEQYIAVLNSIGKKAELEKLKAELYGEEVNAYLANLKGIETETRIYTASLDGDKALLGAELSRFDVYAKQVDVAKDKQALKIQQMKLLTDVNNNKTDIYKTQIQRYLAELKTSGEVFDSELKTHQQQLKTVTTEMLVKREVYKSEFDAIVARGQANRDQLMADVTRLKATADIFLGQLEIQTSTGVAAGQVFGQMAQAMLNSQNTMVSEVTQKSE